MLRKSLLKFKIYFKVDKVLQSLAAKCLAGKIKAQKKIPWNPSE